MNKPGLIITLLLFGLIHPSYAQPTRVLKGEGSYWQCAAYDAANTQWLSKSPYQQVAINQAFDDCKNSSQSPDSCKTANEYCESFIKGVTTRAMWQCTAFDYLAQAWVSDIYLRQYDAALGAKAYCDEQTGMGDACYVNLLTCRNLNLI